MRYITRIKIDRLSAVRHGLRDSYAWHKALWKAFPGRDNEQRDFLHRVDQFEDGFRATLISMQKPEPASWGTWEIRELPERFFKFSRYRFDLRANPTIKRVVRGENGERKRNGRRTAIYDREELKQWLERKSSEAGFDVESLDILPSTSRYFQRKGKTGRHSGVDFQGVLRVTDRERFRAAFALGIGPAKAFGFGMLALEPAG